jgi:hypothetical protein
MPKRNVIEDTAIKIFLEYVRVFCQNQTIQVQSVTLYNLKKLSTKTILCELKMAQSSIKVNSCIIDLTTYIN